MSIRRAAFTVMLAVTLGAGVWASGPGVMSGSEMAAVSAGVACKCADYGPCSAIHYLCTGYDFLCFGSTASGSHCTYWTDGHPGTPNANCNGTVMECLQQRADPNFSVECN